MNILKPVKYYLVYKTLCTSRVRYQSSNRPVGQKDHFEQKSNSQKAPVLIDLTFYPSPKN